jgi:NAD(P)-dependent dehydrogenase (short-subunit alcohol dehydrogenase family)
MTVTVNESREHRVAVISGAGTGIGRALACKFGSMGWSVAVGGRRVELLRDTEKLVGEAGGKAFAGPLDVTSADSIESFFCNAEDALGPVSVAINNAATARYGPLDDFSPDEIAREVETKLLGSLYVARRAIQSMRNQTGVCDIVFVTSVAAVVPWVQHLPYAASNAAAEHAARILKLELEGTGIRVSTFRCGETDGTDFATKELAEGRLGQSSELWFRRGLLRHTATMSPDAVAEGITSMVTLPAGCQYELLQMVPVPPRAPLPVTFEQFVLGAVSEHPTS